MRAFVRASIEARNSARPALSGEPPYTVSAVAVVGDDGTTKRPNDPTPRLQGEHTGTLFQAARHSLVLARAIVQREHCPTVAQVVEGGEVVFRMEVR